MTSKFILDDHNTKDVHVIPHFKPTTAWVHFPDQPNFRWNAREHRKGRHAVAEGQQRKRIVWLNWDGGNISWQVGFLFTFGSVVWVVNGFLIYMPLLHPSEKAHENAAAWTAFAGGTIFLFGAYGALLEALNRGHEVDFGNALLSIQDRLEDAEKAQWPSSLHGHTRHIPIHLRGQHLFRQPSSDQDKPQWYWLGARWDELGYDATLIQMFGAIVFWMSVVTGLPGVLPRLSGPLANGVFWLPQVIGGSGFIISSFIFMLETQTKWWWPAPAKLGWWVGFWNLVGGIGFTLCGALGFSTQSGAVYQSGLATFWGSFAFLIGSYAQWWEGMNEELLKLKI